MKLLVVSDLHGSVTYYEKVKEIADRIKPDKIYFLGDMCDGNGVVPVRQVLDKIYYPLLMVTGNCDVAGVADGLNIGGLGLSELSKDGDRQLFFTHGHLYNSSNVPSVLGDGDVLFYGHFHRTDIVRKHGVWCVCVGSVARPRHGADNAYCVYQDGVITIYGANDDSVICCIDVAEKV